MRIGATFDAQASFFDLMSGGEEKVVPQADTSFCPDDKVYLAPPEPKPWKM